MNSMKNRDKRTEDGAMKYLQSPCTLAEAAQIARGVAEDVLTDYHSRASHLNVALSLQVEILKAIVIKAGLATEEELKEMYIEQAEIFNEMQRARANAESEEYAPDETPESENPTMKVDVSDIEVKKV